MPASLMIDVRAHWPSAERTICLHKSNSCTGQSFGESDRFTITCCRQRCLGYYHQQEICSLRGAAEFYSLEVQSGGAS